MKGHGRLHIEYIKKKNIQHLEDPDRNRRILKYIYIAAAAVAVALACC